MSASALERLSALIAAEGGPLAKRLTEPPPDSAVPGPIVAAGPRAAAAPHEYALLVEAIYEGYLLHYGTSRLLAAGDSDLTLLAGDRLYALGLERLIELDDLLAVCELADAITLCALVHARGMGELAPLVWRAAARAVGYGRSEEYERAKELVTNGAAEAAQALQGAAAGAPKSALK